MHYKLSGTIGSVRKNRDRYKLFLMAVPFIIFIFLMNYVPLFGWVYAFFNYKPEIPLSMTPFVGFKYFRLVFSDNDIFRVLRNTFVFSFLGILTAPLPILFSIMFTEVRNVFFKKVFQTLTTLPYFISWIIVFSLSFAIFSTDGLFNEVFLNLHLISKPTNVLGDINAVWMFQTALTLWKNLGWSTIIYLAAISGIDSEMYDAASIDGAGRFRRIWHITIPGIIPTFLVLLLLSISNLLSLGLEQYIAFYNSLVADKLEVIDYYAYRIGILTQDYSYATAVGIFKSLISIALLFGVNGISKKLRGQSII